MPRLTHLVAVGILAVLGCVQAAAIPIEGSFAGLALSNAGHHRVHAAASLDALLGDIVAVPAEGISNLLVKRDSRDDEDHVYDGRKSKVGTPRPHQGRDIIVPVDADVPVNVDLRAREASSGEVSSFDG